MAVRLPLESLFDLRWNYRSIWIGITVRFELEWPFDLDWNMQISLPKSSIPTGIFLLLGMVRASLN